MMTFSHRPLFHQLLNTVHQFRAPFSDLSITSSFCTPFSYFAPLLTILLTKVYPIYAIFTQTFGFCAPSLGLRPGTPPSQGPHPVLPYTSAPYSDGETIF